MLQGVLLAADQTLSVAGDGVRCQNGVGTPVCHNGTVSYDDNDDERLSTVSRVRLVQFEKHTTDPLVSDLTSAYCYW